MADNEPAYKQKMRLDTRIRDGGTLTDMEQAQYANLQKQMADENAADSVAANQQLAEAPARTTDDLRAKYKQIAEDSRLKAQSPTARAAPDDQDLNVIRGIQKSMKVPGVR